MKAHRYWGPFREVWLSVCSTHQNPRDTCRRCQAGQWRNLWRMRVSSRFFKLSPRLWRLWANRPFCNGTRDFLEKTFTGLRRK